MLGRSTGSPNGLEPLEHNLKISAFFERVLSAKLTNNQTSWGAEQAKTGRVILRVWDDEIDRTKTPNEVKIQRRAGSRKSAGWTGRERHIELMEAGEETYAIVCFKKRTSDRTRIGRYDADIVLRLGEIKARKNGSTYAVIDERVPVSEIIRRGRAKDPIDEKIAALRRAGAKNKEIEALIKLRIGQGRFRTELLRMWNGRCCVTGITTPRAIRASHIKSWKKSTRQECRDPYNGLPLVATLDALFDAGLITFADDGEMRVSKVVSRGERELLGLDGLRMVRAPHSKTARFLKWHRAHPFKK
jgi:hypothetical protein